MPPLRHLKWLDMPPLWTVLFAWLGWIQATRLPVLPIDHPALDLAGGLICGGGGLIMVLAVVEMRRHRTTVIPHQEAEALVTTSVFTRSRHPIYLGDAMILAGLILYWGDLLGLGLVPLFLWVINDRFAGPEEARLKERFGTQYQDWAAKTRRWL